MRRGKSERGSSAVEYGLMVAGVAAAIILPLQSLNFGFSTYAERAQEEECMNLARTGQPCPYAP